MNSEVKHKDYTFERIDLDTIVDEVLAANEEMQSTNKELASANIRLTNSKQKTEMKIVITGAVK